MEADAEHPWRADNYPGIAPMIVRHEVHQAVEPFAITVDRTSTDANAANYTGAVLGSPIRPGMKAGSILERATK